MKEAGPRAWMIIALTFCALGLIFASRSSVGVLIPTWEAELGWARALSATGSSIVLAAMAITMPLAGNLFDRLGPRPVMAGGLAFVGAAMLLTSAAAQEWQFLLFFGVIGGIGMGAVSQPLAATMAAHLFTRDRGLATGLALSGGTAGQLPLLALLSVLVVAWGWRGAYLGLGVAILAMVPIAWVLLRPQPPGQGQTRAATRADTSLFARTVMLARDRTFLLLATTYWLCGFTTAGVFDVHFVPYAVSCGFALTESATAHGVHGVGNMLGLLAFGWLSDRVHRSRLLAAMFAGRALLFVLLLYIAGNPVLLFVFALVFGILNFATLSPIASLVASHFGMRIMGLTLGLLFGVHSLGAATGAILGGYIFDLMARYDWVWLISIVLAFLAAVFSLLINEEHDDARPRWGVPMAA